MLQTTPSLLLSHRQGSRAAQERRNAQREKAALLCLAGTGPTRLYFGPHYCTVAFKPTSAYKLCQHPGSRSAGHSASSRACWQMDTFPLHPVPARNSHEATTASLLDGNGRVGGMNTFPLPWHPELGLLQAEDRQ